MNIQKLLILSLLAPFSMYASVASEAVSPKEIRIELSSKSRLSPIYITKILKENTLLSDSYLEELEKHVLFNFSYNGKTQIVPKTAQKESSLANENYKSYLNTVVWKSFNIPYLIRLSAQDRSLTASVYDGCNYKLKVVPNVPLSGNLIEDKKQMNRLSDAIFKLLFDSSGITNTRILYSCQKESVDGSGHNISEIWECDWDGSNARPITRENAFCVTPVLIPKEESFKKDLFLYVSYKTGQPKILISPLKGGQGKKAVDIRGNQLLPAIARQRDKIAFICDATGRADLFVQSLDPESGKMGTPTQLFSYPRSTQASPTFNADGSQIAFVSDKDGSAKIYVIPSKRGDKRAEPRLISKKNKENSCPCWSPDGTKLAYSAKTNDVRQIWIYDFSTGEEYQLTHGEGHKENPCWAPNSLHMIFNSTDGTSSDLYLVNLNQPEALKITKGPGKKHYPNWGTR